MPGLNGDGNPVTHARWQGVGMTERLPSPANPYAVPLAMLEGETQVSPADHVTDRSDGSGAASWAWDEDRRQAQLAGGA